MTTAQEHDQDSDPPRTAVPPGRPRSGTEPVAVPSFDLTSIDIREGETIGEQHLFNGMECSGGNVSPDLQWSHAPAGTKSFAVTLFDPDAKAGAGWWHWVMVDIPPSVNHLPPGTGDPAHAFMPEIVQWKTSFGKAGYGGPCPPKGDPPHRYVFSVHALDVDSLEAPDAATLDDVDFLIHAHIIASATLTARYGR